MSRGITYGVIKLGNEVANGVPCLRTSNVRQLYIDTAGIKRISKALSNSYARTILQGGELLVNVRGTLGGVAVVPKEMVGWNVSREVAVVPINAEDVDPDYLAFFIATDASQRWLTGVLKGVAYTGINLTDLRELPTLVPSREIQARVVQKVKAAQVAARSLAASCEDKADHLLKLKQSILQKAFSGELTAKPDRVLAEFGA